METAQLLLRGAGGLLAVLGTLWVCVRVVKARSGASGVAPAVRLRVLARVSLGRHASVVTLDAGDRVLVLGVGDQGVRLLAEQPALPEVAPATERVELDLDLDRDLDRDGTDRAAVTVTVPAAVPAPRSAVAGSLVDPATWRAVVGVARERTVRR